jgi:hypothetical protein
MKSQPLPAIRDCGHNMQGVSSLPVDSSGIDEANPVFSQNRAEVKAQAEKGKNPGATQNGPRLHCTFTL